MTRTARRLRLVARLLPRICRALAHRYHPLMVQVVPMRRCNLSCTYCVEYDEVSAPVPLPVMQRRLDLLADLGTAILTISGGEPTLHPELDGIIAHARRRGMIATLITNGYLLSPERIHRFNRAGLDHLQISIDNVEPDDVSKKSLRLLAPKLHWLAEHAEFEVNINSVLGGGIKNPADALAIFDRARELGFSSSVGLLDGQGAAISDWPEEMAVYAELKRRRDWTSWFNGRWQDNIAEGRSNDWRCRAGARYLYVDEFGLVHYCSAQRGAPAIPLERYSREDIRREFHAAKDCAPWCTINCVQQASLLDAWRSPQKSVARTVRLVVKGGAPVPNFAQPDPREG